MQTTIPKPHDKKMLVTPELAKKMLEGNIKNRSFKEKKITQYANDIRRGAWQEDTYEFIKFSPSGTLLDGQNRLAGVIRANKPALFQIAYNVPDRVFTVLDTGAVRNGSDTFKISGVLNNNILPSIILLYTILEKGGASRKGASLTNQELLKLYQEREEYWQLIARKTFRWYNRCGKILATSTIGGIYAHLRNRSEKDADSFMECLCTGMNIKNKLIGQLRGKLTENLTASRKMTDDLKLALIIRTWNYYRNPESKVRLLKFDVERDIFPKAI